MGASTVFRKIVTFVATILVAVIGFFIIRIVNSELSDVEYSPENLPDVADGDFGNLVQEKACLLDANRDDDEDSLCLLAYVGVGITFAVMFTLSILLVCTALTALSSLRLASEPGKQVTTLRELQSYMH